MPLQRRAGVGAPGTGVGDDPFAARYSTLEDRLFWLDTGDYVGADPTMPEDLCRILQAFDPMGPAAAASLLARANGLGRYAIPNLQIDGECLVARLFVLVDDRQIERCPDDGGAVDSSSPVRSLISSAMSR